MQPVGNYVFLKPILETRSAGGVFIPAKVAKAHAQQATVLAVGPGKPDPRTGDRVPIPLRVGDVVVWRGAEAVDPPEELEVAPGQKALVVDADWLLGVVEA